MLLVETTASLLGSDGGVIAASEVHEILTKIHDILGSDVSKQVSNMPLYLPYPFHSASRLCGEVWPSHFPFLHSINDFIHPSEACLNMHINWSLTKAHQHFYLNLFKSSKSKGVQSQAGFCLNVQKWPVSESCDASLVKKPCIDTKPDAHQGRRKSPGSTSASSTESMKKGSHGDSISDVLQSLTSLPSYSYHVQVGTLPKFSDQWLKKVKV